MRKNKKIVVILLIIIAISLISYLLTRDIVKQSMIKIVAQYQTAKTSTTEDGRFEYRELSGGTIEITKYVGTDTVVEIPSTIAGKSVTRIGNSTFHRCSSLTNIIIPEGVISIGDGAFSECSSLTNIKVDSNNKNYCDIDGVLYTKDITKILQYPAKKNGTQYNIPKGVTSIGRGVFCGCSSLTNITIPEGVTSIGADAFSKCSSLTNITIPKGVTTIEDKTFYRCSSLTNITIPEGVTRIRAYAFSECSSLSNITIPEGVTYIGMYAFSECSSLSNITIPEGVTSIDINAFDGCSSLTNITIPEGVTSIEGRTFYRCSSLTNISIPEGVTSIGADAFRECSSLTKITIPESVTRIGDRAFSDCKKLTNVTIPCGVSIIEERTFYQCENLSKIKIPEGVTSIESYAFYECNTLIDMIIPTSVESIGESAFFGCHNIRKLIVPDGVNTIGNHAFSCCWKIRELVLPIRDTHYGKGVFDQTRLVINVADQDYIEEIELPNIIKNVLNGTDTLLTYDRYELRNCTLNADKTKLSIVNQEEYAEISFKGGILGNLAGDDYAGFEVIVSADRNAPTEPTMSKSSGDNWTNKDVILSAYSEDQSSGISQIQYSYDKNNWFDDWETLDFTGTREIIQDGNVFKEFLKCRGTALGKWSKEGSYTVYTRAIDNVGNVSEISSINLKIDKTAPTVTNVSVSKTNTNESTVTIYANVEDIGGAEIEEVSFNGWFGGDWKTSNSKVSGTYDPTNKRYYATFTFSDIEHTLTGETGNGEGTYTFEAVAIDKAGNSIDSPNINVVYDIKKPTCTITADKLSPTNASTITYTFTFSEEVIEFTKEDVTVTNGIKGTFSRSENIYTLVVTNDGTCTQTVHIPNSVCTDIAGNKNTSASKEITIDRMNPTVGTMTMKLESSTGTNYINNTWTSENVYISVNNGFDDESGHKSTTYRINGGEEITEPQTLIESGTYEIVVTTTDNAGNTATNTYIVKIRRAESIEITKNPIKLTYLVGDKFYSSGMEVSVIYDNQDKEKTTEYTIVNWPYALKCGKNKIEIQYNNNPEIKTELEVEAQHIEEILAKKEPTCTEVGLTEGKHCKACKEILEEQKEIQALGHDFVEYISDGNATCTQDGTKTAKCNRCEETDIKIIEGSKLPHREVIDKGKPATCTEKGVTDGKHCEVCNEIVEEQKEIPALDHSYTNYISDGNATCTQDGTETAKCDRCEETDTQTDAGSKIPHREVIDKGKPATCTEKGLTDGKHCEICKTVLVEQKEISALGHNYEEKVTTPKCSEKGYTTHTCTRCKDSYIDTYTDALGHSFTNYTSDENATCTKDGTKTAKCDRCDVRDTQTDVGSKIPHNYVNQECTMCKQKESNIELTSNKFKIENKNISQIEPKMTIKDLKENISTNATEVKIYDKDQVIQDENEMLKTGMQLELNDGKEKETYIIVVNGDLNCDGKANILDMVMMNRHRLNKKILEGEYLIAGDITGDNKIDIIDIVKINKYRLSKITQILENIIK